MRSPSEADTENTLRIISKSGESAVSGLGDGAGSRAGTAPASSQPSPSLPSALSSAAQMFYTPAPTAVKEPFQRAREE